MVNQPATWVINPNPISGSHDSCGTANDVCKNKELIKSVMVQLNVAKVMKVSVSVFCLDLPVAKI